MIEARQLTRRFGTLTAVDDLSFAVAPGEVLGFLGPNGAGKTTTMRLLTGFLAPTSGAATIFGHDVQRSPRQARAVLGYLPEGAPAWDEMTVGELLAFVARVRRLAPSARRDRLAQVAERLGLGPVLDRRIETLSKGFRRRAGLAQAILHDPPALVLDEPTDGLDPNQKHEVRGLIREMSRDKVIIVSTHILEEVEAVCTRAIIIAGGRLLVDDTPQGLAARAGSEGPTAARIDAAFRAITTGAGHG
jgi:ABC-2 type transport system ATP-binding protein